MRRWAVCCLVCCLRGLPTTPTTANNRALRFVCCRAVAQGGDRGAAAEVEESAGLQRRGNRGCRPLSGWVSLRGTAVDVDAGRAECLACHVCQDRLGSVSVGTHPNAFDAVEATPKRERTKAQKGDSASLVAVSALPSRCDYPAASSARHLTLTSARRGIVFSAVLNKSPLSCDCESPYCTTSGDYSDASISDTPAGIQCLCKRIAKNNQEQSGAGPSSYTHRHMSYCSPPQHISLPSNAILATGQKDASTSVLLCCKSQTVVRPLGLPRIPG